jgi:hypothetical protein
LSHTLPRLSPRRPRNPPKPFAYLVAAGAASIALAQSQYDATENDYFPSGPAYQANQNSHEAQRDAHAM